MLSTVPSLTLVMARALTVVLACLARLRAIRYETETQPDVDEIRMPTKDLCPAWSASLSEFSKFAGRGGYGTVFTAEVACSPEQPVTVAIKLTALRNDEKLGPALAEATMIERLDHPNIIKGYASDPGDISSPTVMRVMMEAGSGGELYDFVTSKNALEEVELARLVHEIALGIQYLHDHGIVHGDLKLENILLDKPCSIEGAGCHIKIIDFGLACVLAEETRDGQLSLASPGDCSNICGTPYYISPELANDMTQRKTMRKRPNDMWALGIMLHVMLFKRYPVDMAVKQFYRFLKNIYETDTPLQYIGKPKPRGLKLMNEHLSETAYHLLELLLQPRPMKRATAAQAVELSAKWLHDLRHPLLCHRYIESQDDAWCANVGEVEGYKYMFFKGGGPCDDCWCCKRKSQAEASPLHAHAAKLPSCWHKCQEKQCEGRCVEMQALNAPNQVERVVACDTDHFGEVNSRLIGGIQLGSLVHYRSHP